MRALPNRPQARTNSKTYNTGKIRYNGLAYIDWLQHITTFNSYAQDDQDALVDRALADWKALGKELITFRHDGFLPRHHSHDTGGTLPSDTANRGGTPAHLYALEAEDLLDFTTDDLIQAWALRTQTCGSKEAAAEMYALYRVLHGDDDTYAGATAYLYHPDVVAIFSASAEQEQAVQIEVISPVAGVDTESKEVLPAAALTLASLSGLSIDELKTAWKKRPESFASLEAAAETLAILRSLNVEAPEIPSYRRMMQHELILDLADSLPLEVHSERQTSARTELALLQVDRRVVRTQNTVIRSGQVGFRVAMLERFGGECCITKCRIDTLLEAAHIIPYRGEQSNDVTNGLLLRVDLHRLFDAYLMTINPKNFAVEFANSIGEAGYLALSGQQLFNFSSKPRGLFLEAHYAAFQKAERNRQQRSAV